MTNDYTTAQVHYQATTMMRLNHDTTTGEYFSIYGQYAKPELVGTRRIVTVEEIKRNMASMLRDFARYGCD